MQELIQVLKTEQKLKASQILRDTKYQQHFRGICDIHNPNKVCAVGVFHRFFGWDGVILSSTINRASELTTELIGNVWDDIVYQNNEERKSFSEIADWLEERGL